MLLEDTTAVGVYLRLPHRSKPGPFKAKIKTPNPREQATEVIHVTSPRG